MIPMQISDIADRYSILMLKWERARMDVMQEMGPLKVELELFPMSIWKYVNQLLKVNGDIWTLESDIRQGKEGHLGLEEVGRRAIAIRNLNGKRIEIKNLITKRYTRGGFMEIKKDHASA